MSDPTIQKRSSASFSVASIVAVLAAIFSFVVNPIFGLILAVVGIVFGLLGALVALSPTRRGGFASTFAVIAGFVGVIAAVIRAIMWMLGG